jgi:hypothetical protein
VIGMIAGRGRRQSTTILRSEATVMSLPQRVRLLAADLSKEGAWSHLLIIPDGRQSVQALEDSAVLLTVAKT